MFSGLSGIVRFIFSGTVIDHYTMKERDKQVYNLQKLSQSKPPIQESMRRPYKYDDDEEQDAFMLVCLCICWGLKEFCTSVATICSFNLRAFTIKESSSCAKDVYHPTVWYRLSTTRESGNGRRISVSARLQMSLWAENQMADRVLSELGYAALVDLLPSLTIINLL